MRARARELHGDPTIREPGVSELYCLSEVVHCKTRGEEGVQTAADTCASLYVHRLLDASGARLVVVLGDAAARQIRRRFSIPPDANLTDIHSIGGRDVRFALLPHPNQRGKRKVGCSPLTPDELAVAREHLRTAR